MKKVKVQLENCYGIKKLDTEFDFSEQNVYAIYAPNGSMKTSLAKTFALPVEVVAPHRWHFGDQVRTALHGLSSRQKECATGEW